MTDTQAEPVEILLAEDNRGGAAFVLELPRS
jgi:hypothetical protein